MGTKNNPGAYDCYAKLDPDEPYFLLRGKDPAAPYLTKLWAASRMGNEEAVHNIVEVMFADHAVQARVSSEEHEKLTEAKACAGEMLVWRREREAANAGKP